MKWSERQSEGMSARRFGVEGFRAGVVGYNCGFDLCRVVFQLVPKAEVLRGSLWVETELSAKEQDANPVVAEIAKASRGGFEALDLRI